MISTPLFLLRLESSIYEFIQVGEIHVGRTLVTQEMWEEIMGYNSSNYLGPSLPVDNVSYTEIEAFLYKLQFLTWECTGVTFTFCLMSETEWTNIAADSLMAYGDSKIVTNAGVSSGFSGLNLWSAENSDNQPHPVAMTVPDENGLYDMYGNVWEICVNQSSQGPAINHSLPQRVDFNNELDYKKALLKYNLLNTRTIDHQLEIVLKGGAWNMYARDCTKQSRIIIGEQDKFANAGFRICIKM